MLSMLLLPFVDNFSTAAIIVPVAATLLSMLLLKRLMSLLSLLMLLSSLPSLPSLMLLLLLLRNTSLENLPDKFSSFSSKAEFPSRAASQNSFCETKNSVKMDWKVLKLVSVLTIVTMMVMEVDPCRTGASEKESK